MTKWWNGRHTTLRTSRRMRHGSSTLPLVTRLSNYCRRTGVQLAFIRPVGPDQYRGLQLTRVGWCPAEFHMLSRPGSTPGPAIFDRVRKLAKRRGREPRDFVGSTPTSVTCDRVVQRQRRLGDNQESAGSIPAAITRWSVGALAAHLLGTEEDPVQIRDGPLTLWAGMFPGGD
jgi:hypothetical protein